MAEKKNKLEVVGVSTFMCKGIDKKEGYVRNGKSEVPVIVQSYNRNGLVKVICPCARFNNMKEYHECENPNVEIDVRGECFVYRRGL